MLNYEPKIRLKLRRTKIVATLGPASSEREILEELFLAGANIVRLNFSHGTYADHLSMIEKIRELSSFLNIPVCILGDLCGPKIRVGKFEEKAIPLTNGELVTITVEPVIGKKGLIPSQYLQLIQDIRLGQTIFMDDGNLELQVVSIDSPRRATLKVLKGGILKDHKGMNLPGSALSVPALTEKDHEDLKFCLAHDVDYVALSFVRKASEIVDLREKIEAITTEGLDTEYEKKKWMVSATRVIAKIEKPEALQDIEGIIDAADGIMIARGDLGVEMPLEKVPLIQAQLVKMASQRNKPVIVATQMLESMTSNAHPTRAEVSDVATAVLSGADAVMLSGETAAGKYPVESVKIMDSIVREVESYQWSQGHFGALQKEVSIDPVSNTIARAATLISKDLEIHAINVPTYSGRTARMISVARPNCPILAYCDHTKVVRQMQLYWGVVPFWLDRHLDLETFSYVVEQNVKEMGIAEPGHYVLLVSSPIRSGVQRHVNSIMIYQIS